MDIINDQTVEAANRRGAAKKATYPSVVAARYDRRISRIVISLDTGLDLSFSPHHAQSFEAARPEDLDVVEISPSGLGVHFPKIDVDIYVPSLIEGLLGSKRWMAAQNGRVGGKATTSVKGAAARKNGLLAVARKRAMRKRFLRSSVSYRVLTKIDVTLASMC
ncbi:DUF2442 domain-containing protein [Duganella hordei]|uniref:DUF2442 domain-containing protein n=1 Tax=Duganella hordei TaxID=2865934 RepID=UPI0030EA1237